jgi:capsular polysaccharide biosynthesis protein
MSVITEERANSRPQYEVSCVVLPDSSVLQLSVKGPSPQLTADLANTIGAAGLDYVQSLQEVYNLRVLDAAATPDSPIAPVMPVNLGLGATIGLIMGLVVTYIQQTFIQQRQAALSPAPGSSAL